MQTSSAEVDRYDRLVAVLFAAVAVLGVLTVAVSLVTYFPGASGLDVPLP